MINLSEEMKTHGQIVLVLQGGGALGAYQAGVYQAMHETGIDPDWVIGTSIGAINASIIAGNMRDRCLERLREFWVRVEQHDLFGPPDHWFGQLTRNMHTISMGLPAFFKPNVQAFMNPHTRLGPENAAYYSVEPLRETLSDLVDF
ncbi:MAG: patatin-like phospholipase family protein, partial [Pseudomonadota bacterium]